MTQADERSIKFTHGSLYMVVGQLAKAGFIAEQETSRQYRLALLAAESAFVRRFIEQTTDPDGWSRMWAEFHGEPAPGVGQ